MAHKKIQVGTQKITCFIKEKDGKETRNFSITKSYKDEAGNWKDTTMNLFPNELLVMYEMIGRMLPLAMPVVEFELKPKETPVDEAQVAAEIGDDIPF